MSERGTTGEPHRRPSWWQSQTRRIRNGWRLLHTDGLGAFHTRLSGRFRRTLESPLARARIALAAWDLSAVSLPSPADPDVSIIIPARDKWRITLRCLRSIARRTSGPSYEVILVDDGSRDQTTRADVLVPGLRRVGIATSGGFVGACNTGAAAARGKYLLFLNNDTIVTDGWLSALVETCATRPDCAAVGAKLVFPNGLLQEAGGIVWADGSAWNYGRGRDPRDCEFNYARPVDYCSGAALMVRRDAFETVGGFDTRFAPAYWEDADLAFSLREAGWSVWVQPASIVYHVEGQSAGTSEARGMKRFQAANRGVFREKWAARLAEQPAFAETNMWTACSRHRRPALLFLDHHVPMPDRDAGSLFVHRALTSLVRDGYRVVFWPDNLYRLPGYAEPLERMGVQVAFGHLHLPEFLESLGRPLDGVIAYRAEIAARLLPIVKPFARRMAYVAVDLEAVRETRRADLQGTAAHGADALWQREAAAVRLADVVAAHSPIERALLERLAPGRPVLEMPLPVAQVATGTRPFAERAGLVFVGSTHPPNVDAIAHFAARIWPEVHAALGGDVVLRVIGEVCNRVPDLARVPGVTLMGHVADLDEWLGQSRVFVAPLRYGAGIKGKVLTAMQAGVPVVTSEVGAEGIGIVHGESALVAQSDEDFVRETIRAYTTPALWERLRRQALTLVAERHAAAPFDRALDRLVTSLLGASSATTRPSTPSSRAL